MKSKFNGTLGMTFGYSLLMALTFYIPILGTYVRNKYYHYVSKNTVLSGKQIKYDGIWKDLVLINIVGILLSIVTFGIYTFWWSKNILNYILDHVSVDSEKFKSNVSALDIFIYCLLAGLSVITLGAMIPVSLVWLYKTTALKANHKNYKLSYDGSYLSAVGHFYLLCLLLVVTFGLFFIWQQYCINKYIIERCSLISTKEKNNATIESANVKTSNVEKTTKISETEEEETEDDSDDLEEMTPSSRESRNIYHISQNKNEKSQYYKMWRVRREGSTKTIKYFNTQKEAIDFANKIVENNDGQVVVHRIDGKIRKQGWTNN